MKNHSTGESVYELKHRLWLINLRCRISTHKFTVRFLMRPEGFIVWSLRCAHLTALLLLDWVKIIEIWHPQNRHSLFYVFIRIEERVKRAQVWLFLAGVEGALGAGGRRDWYFCTVYHIDIYEKTLDWVTKTKNYFFIPVILAHFVNDYFKGSGYRQWILVEFLHPVNIYWWSNDNSYKNSEDDGRIELQVGCCETSEEEAQEDQK